ncbi:MAG: hypothetical protein HQ596_03140 [Candidatus Saganbacteria bacterium]|nr:hypothetical protein [Candidatus Saganbacteria bacterium]
MKRLLMLLLSVSMLASPACAEIMTTGQAVGLRNLAVKIGGIQELGVAGLTTQSINFYGIGIEYGITSHLELDLSVGTGSYLGNNTSTVFHSTPVSLGLKYSFLRESEGDRFSLAGFGETKAFFHTVSSGTDQRSMFFPLIGIGVVLSKQIRMLEPYLGFKSSTLLGVNLINELTLGTTINWSENGKLFVEYSSQSISLMRGTSSLFGNQVGIGTTLYL